MKEKILELRANGKSYKQISEELQCSKSTVSYYCGKGQKEKNRERAQKRRADLVITRKIDNFQKKRAIRDKAEDFQRPRLPRNSKGRLGKRKITFRWRDVIAKFGWETNCYLTGKRINLKEAKTYNFDHIIPPARGGSNEIDNLGICIRNANQAKSDMLVGELLDLCVEILEHNGYEVSKKGK